MTRLRALALAGVLAAASLSGVGAAGPVGPCDFATGAVDVALTAPGAPPRVESWTDVSLSLGAGCGAEPSESFSLVIALSGQFEGPADLDVLATRIGAISAGRGLRYWSVTDGDWRELIADAYATLDASGDVRRHDFDAVEVKSGDALYFAQDDTRSTGWNVYAMRARLAAPGLLVMEARNLTDIGVLFVTLFPAGDVFTVHAFRRLGGQRWGYYGLSAVRSSGGAGLERSFINRANAYFRFLQGRAGDDAEPLVR